MALSAPLADAALEANAAEVAAGILGHPLARRLGWDAVWVLHALAAGDLSIRPADALPVLRLALAGIDAGEIELGLETP